MTTVSIPPKDDGTPQEIDRRLSRGSGWSRIGQVLSRTGTFATSIILARLLGPIDFGEVAAALVVVNILMSVNELGVIPALVRWRGDVRPAAATATTIALVTSLFMYGVAFVIAPGVANLTNTPGSISVTRIMALTVIVNGIVAVPLALLHRQLRTVAQMTAEVVGILSYIVVAVSLANVGVDASAIAWGLVVGAVATAAIMIAVSPWPARPSFDLGIARQLVRYGLPLALGAAVFEGVMNVDYLIVGRELAGASLGMYLLAFTFASWPVSIVGVAIGRLSFADHSASKDDPERLISGFIHSIAVALSALVPMVLVLAVLAPEVVDVVYGAVWADAAAPARWLLVLGGLRVLLQLASEVIAVIGRTTAVLYVHLLWLLALPPFLDFGAEHGGLTGVGMVQVGVALAVAVPCFLFELRRIGVPLRDLAKTAIRPAVAGCGALLVMLAFRLSFDGSMGRALVLAALGGLTYTALLLPGNETVALTWAQLRGARVRP